MSRSSPASRVQPRCRRPPLRGRRWWRFFLAAVAAALLGLLGATAASATAVPELETRVGASTLTSQIAVGIHDTVWAGQRWVHGPPQAQIVSATGVAAKTGTSGADDVLNGVRLRAQLTGQEISGGHAFSKHVVQGGEFPGITTRSQFAQHIEDVVSNGVMRPLSNGRSAYWQNGTVVIRNPNAVDGGMAFRPTNGYDYFLNLH